MAIAETNNNHPKLLPLTDSQGRHKKRVAFSETIINHNYKIHKDSPRHPPFLSVCFSWTCLALTTLLLLLLLLVLGFASCSILRSALPQIRITKLQRSNHPNSIGQRALNYDSNFTVEFTNNNERVYLSYGSLAFQMSSLQKILAQANVEGFSQATGNVTTLNVMSTSERNSKVDDPNSFNGSMMVVDILLTGYVKFYVGGLKTYRMQMEAKCGGVKQADGGSGTKCNVELFYLKYLNF
ncbi:uncharacterized protein LOC116105793 [Pistacia vera]|uniref:uncharacterized protein LOC116105793 n=1 Tax=Pistacia vera TaxID=55513 RepID=UPI001263CD8C|nr:uncharacterized protein LOC116105793 [Pistacia vera]